MHDLRAELKELRKAHPDHRSVSKMPMADVAMAIGKLRSHLESSPSIAHDGGKAKKPMKAATENVKEAKKAEFPVAPAGDMAAPKAPKAPKAKKEAAPAPEAPPAPEAAPAKKGRHPKGSDEAKAHMAAIRGKKGKKAE